MTYLTDKTRRIEGYSLAELVGYRILVLRYERALPGISANLGASIP